MKVLKTNDDLQIVWGEVYAPSPIPDSQGDVMTLGDVREMAYRFMTKGTGQIDLDHSRNPINAHVIESFIVRKGDPDFPIPGAWVVGVYVEDPHVWNSVKNGDFNAFSLDGSGYAETVELEVYLPDIVKGETSVDHGHSHSFTVFFDEDGKFLGGKTDTVNGHSHKILRGTLTQITDDHRHTFSFIEGLLDVA